MINTLRSRTIRLLALIATLSTLAAVAASAASAQIVGDGPYANPSALPGATVPAVPAATVHAGSGSGLAVWLVIVIAIAALAVGAALAEFARSLLRGRRVHRLTVAAS